MIVAAGGEHAPIATDRQATDIIAVPFQPRLATGRPAQSGCGRPDRLVAQLGGSHGLAGGMGRRRVLVHSSGFKLSPYADIRPAGDDTKTAPRTLWHRSPGSAG